MYFEPCVFRQTKSLKSISTSKFISSLFSEVSSTPHIFPQKFVLTAHLPVRDIFPTHVIIIIIFFLDLTTVLILKLQIIILYLNQGIFLVGVIVSVFAGLHQSSC